MAWYSDEKYEFRKDCGEKKSIAASSHKQRTHTGKGGSVKFPSDFMSRKELKAMDGKCEEYKMNKPMSWETFKKLPNDLKVEYITKIRERFQASDAAIAEMFGIARNTLCVWFTDLKLNRGPTSGRRKWDEDAFYRWAFPTRYLNENKEEIPVIEPSLSEDCVADDTSIEVDNKVPEVQEQAENGNEECAIGEYTETTAIPNSGSLDFNCDIESALRTLRMLLGDSRVKLKVEWRVMRDRQPDCK